MRDPFKINGLTCISFSGGRTSAYMLWRVLQSNGGLPDDAVVAFANTGKEEEATLRFVRDCGVHWGVPIVWLEYRDNPEQRFAVVDYESASRQGEPFEAAIRNRKYLPNPVTRFCTVELKIRTMHRYLKSLGWKEDGGWDQMVGIRADEPRRVAKIRARGRSTETSFENMLIPLADAGVTVQDVNAFWAAQPFNLDLTTVNGRTLAGNCDLCFLKPVHQRLALIQQKPERAAWWIKMESIKLSDKPSGERFTKDGPSYADLSRFASVQGALLDADGEAIDCFCGD